MKSHGLMLKTKLFCMDAYYAVSVYFEEYLVYNHSYNLYCLTWVFQENPNRFIYFHANWQLKCTGIASYRSIVNT